jgi:hypothetical protein
MTATASIDDLLQYEEEPPPSERPPSGLARWVVRAILVAAGLTALITIVLRTVGVTPPYALVFAGLFALLALRRIVVRIAPLPPSRTRHAHAPSDDDGRYDWGVPDALLSAQRRWEGRLAMAWGDRDRFARSAQLAIREVVDERLRLRFGVTTGSDPARARAVLDDALWTFMTAPVGRAPRPAVLADLVGRVERLEDRAAVGIRPPWASETPTPDDRQPDGEP